MRDISLKNGRKYGGLFQPMSRLIKMVFEIMLALIMLLLLWPLLFILAILVKMSSRGPVFFTSARLGLNGRPFVIFKFRTMYHKSDEVLEKIKASSSDVNKQWKENFKLENDPRITPLGRFLRKTSLDELPQLWNVLKGDMAVIGPRPIVQDEIAKYGEAYDLLKMVRPGMTGLWQVSGRSTLSYEQRVQLDTLYVTNWSLALDCKILLKTPGEVICGRGAF